MKRFVFYLALTAALSSTNITHTMQVAQPLAHAAPRFFNEPSFVKALRLAVAPFLTTRLSTPTGAANGANPMPIIVPAWWSTPNSNGKIGMSLATASVIATAFAIFVIWYIHDEYYKRHSTTRTLGGAIINTGFTTVKRCLYVMGNALLFGLAFWGLESCFLYGLEKIFQISVNNPQMYNILLTVLAASFYVMITEVVKEKWKTKKTVSISAQRDTTPKDTVPFIGSFPAAAVPDLFQNFLINKTYPSTFEQDHKKPILIIGTAGAGKTILLHDIQSKANSYFDIPCHSLILAYCNSNGTARKDIEQAVSNLAQDAHSRGQDKGILFIDDIDQAHNKHLMQDLTQYLEWYHLNDEPKTHVKIIVIATATLTDDMGKWRHKFELCPLQNFPIPANRVPVFDFTANNKGLQPSSTSASSSVSRLKATPSISESEQTRADSVFDRIISSSSSAASSSGANSCSSPLLSSASAVTSSAALSSNS